MNESSADLNITANRSARKYSAKEMMRRVLWMLGSLFFRYSPRTFFGFRSALLRCFGAEVGRGVHIYNSAVIYMPWNLVIGDDSAIGEDALIYNLGPVSLGKRVTISHKAHICAGSHDYELASLPLLKPPVVVEDEVWICADAFVGPNVLIGRGAVVGARAVAVSDVPSMYVVAGNPAKKVKMRAIRKG